MLFWSEDYGVTWNSIAETPDDGEYVWMPTVDRERVRVRIDRYRGSGASRRLVSSDASEGNFGIAPAGVHSLTVSPNPLHLQSGTVGIGNTEIYTVHNEMCGTVSGTFTLQGSPEFELWFDTFQVGRGGEGEYRITYRPADCGADTATVLIDTGELQRTLTLIGQGPDQPTCSTWPWNLEFAMEPPGAATTQTFRLWNVGCAPLQGTFASDNPNFEVSPASFNLASKDSLHVEVTYQSGGCYPDTARITSDVNCGTITCVAVDLSTTGNWTDGTTWPLDMVAPVMATVSGDYDQDGDDDIFVAVYNGADRLMRNDGEAGFAVVTPTLLADTGPGYGAAWGDGDGDGDPDLYVAMLDGADRLYENLGSGSFRLVGGTGLGDPGPGTSVDWVDADGDGDLDLYVTRYEATGLMLRNDGGWTFTPLTVAGLFHAGPTMDAAWGDYDGDGDPDVYRVENEQPNMLFRNLGNWRFEDVTMTELADESGGIHGTWGDFDRDGLLDLALTAQESTNFLYRQLPGGGFTYHSTPPGYYPRAFSWFDFDNDADLDFYLVLCCTGSNRLGRNELEGGAATFDETTEDPMADSGNGMAMTVSDFDLDGWPDVYLGNHDTGNHMFFNDLDLGACRSWVQVDLEGAQSNRMGVGARITVVAGGVRQIREVGGGVGRCQNSLTASFGLGVATMVDSLIVRWPWRGTDVLTGLPTNVRYSVREGGGIAPVDEGQSEGRETPTVLTVHDPSPNPFNPSTVIRFELPASAIVSLEVFDATGRRIRSLIGSEPFQPGFHESRWNGLDDAGRAVASGLYLYRLTAGDEGRVGKMVMLK
jgi:hypothetical protein